MSENICPYTLCMFSLVTEKDGDINKVIADAYFDYYVSSERHTDMLLNENHIYYGFGLSMRDKSMFGVVEGVWYSFPISDILSAIICSSFLKINFLIKPPKMNSLTT